VNAIVAGSLASLRVHRAQERVRPGAGSRSSRARLVGGLQSPAAPSSLYW
jgi:hypothetical protein